MDFGSSLSFNTVTVAIVVVLLILLVSRTLQWSANVPPGPSGYPIIGSMPLLRKGNILEIFRKLRAQYGDVFSIKIGPNLAVVINGADALKEAFVKRADEFSDRPSNYFIVQYMINVKKLIQNFTDIKCFALEQIAEHRKTFAEENQRDFIDAFLRQQIKHDEDDPIFDDMNLATVVINLFLAGTETTATMIRWAILYLIHNKPIQDKLRQEIETVIGTSRLPSLCDKPSMPYYEAFITEVFRMGNIAPLSVPHGAKKDIQFRGRLIPKGSVIMANLDSVMTDPDLFENPDKFQPERFLGKDGQMNGKERTVMAFSLGRRICLGESLARLELFLFLTSLLQRFEFLPESPDKLPSFDSTLGVARASTDYKCCAVKLK
ncbi:cytochrome P450 2D4-like [Mizuhopecten yessoensis]|uniref:cytochrome P450 2D4-like n=1 Tax=Mizuhopecten yessoensis TaxID=6573 RepID=UPI000B45CC80|nr:cytochrome P450 2D4-like [Mizuhopecten yessoensis]